ncbi:LysR family transcriptional regulator [Rhizobium sp. CFBP 13726]|uniref:LysR family transcriptional regulator n=1 Tax=Rhizobium sp. CFBP 13726 TaxID=2775296 RepID=UPI00177E81C0|nr:LysR family transcriptional regulator [Rhizobium sp. CFBP 13726]MBD8653656.1 LysR family transcriptional regulator [Rhizobium sp. CFBP 13726]
MRLTDLETTIELLVEANANVDGARDRIAARYAIQKSVITDRVKRTEEFFGAELFGGPQRKEPTRAGKFVARRGHQLLAEITFFGDLVREEAEER